MSLDGDDVLKRIHACVMVSRHSHRLIISNNEYSVI